LLFAAQFCLGWIRSLSLVCLSKGAFAAQEQDKGKGMEQGDKQLNFYKIQITPKDLMDL